MNSTIRKYVVCPDCGKPYRDHDSRFNGAEEREQDSIDIQRSLPQEKFLNWLLEQRQYFIQQITETHRAIISEFKAVNMTNMALLNVWYNYIDIYDAEIKKCSTGEIGGAETTDGGEYLLPESVIIALWEEFEDEFPGEDKQLWKSRWINDGIEVKPISIEERFKRNNNKHLVLQILHEASHLIDAGNLEKYIKTKWGISLYHTQINRYIPTEKNPGVIGEKYPHKLRNGIRKKLNLEE